MSMPRAVYRLASILGHLFFPLLEARGCIQLLRLVSVLVVIWYERLTFMLASLECSATSMASLSSLLAHQRQHLLQKHSPDEQGVTLRLTILSDPQLIDSHTYNWVDQLIPPFSSFIQYLLRWASDTYAQKSFAAVIRQSGKVQSDGVIWLGDLLDGGRRSFLSTEDVQAFEKQVRRFKGLFEERIASLYLPGNHDVRIPLTHDPTFEQEWKDSKVRWLEEWGIRQDDRNRATWSRKGGKEHVVIYPPSGPNEVIVEAKQWKNIINARFPLYLNQTSSIPTHEIVLVDSLELAGMLPAAVASNLGFDWQDEAKRRFQETYDFIESFSIEAGYENIQRVLISHIPLSRPANSNCNLQEAHHGVLRESHGVIDQGVDQYATYQNLLSLPVTEWVLNSIQPKLIFSGDNHDHCEVQHLYGRADKEIATELTLKAFSMTEGVRLPGYARLLLHFDGATGQTSSSYAPCLLPDQISIWTQSYPFFLAFILVSLLLDRRWRLGAILDQQAQNWMIRWQDWIGYYEGEEDEVEEDKDWQMVEEGAIPRRDSNEYQDDSFEGGGGGGGGGGNERHHLPSSKNTIATNSNSTTSPGKRIRFGKSSLALQPITTSKIKTTPKSIQAKSSTSPSFISHSAASSFQTRAWRELRKAARANEKVLLRDGPLREMSKILIWPLVVWVWLQLF